VISISIAVGHRRAWKSRYLMGARQRAFALSTARRAGGRRRFAAVAGISIQASAPALSVTSQMLVRPFLKQQPYEFTDSCAQNLPVHAIA